MDELGWTDEHVVVIFDGANGTQWRNVGPSGEFEEILRLTSIVPHRADRCGKARSPPRFEVFDTLSVLFYDSK